MRAKKTSIITDNPEMIGYKSFPELKMGLNLWYDISDARGRRGVATEL